MNAPGGPEWLVREDAAPSTLVALHVRQVLGIRAPHELPALRDVPGSTLVRDTAEQAELERQWLAYWALTVEPQAHPSPVPLDLVDGFEMLVALPTEGFDLLAEQMRPHAASAVDYAHTAHGRYRTRVDAASATSYRAYASALAQYERRIGRRAHSFELNVQVLPLAQRGLWWIGSLTIAVTDGLRGDVVAFDSAIAPIIAEIA